MTGHEPVGDRWTSISDGVPRRWYRDVPAPDRTDLRIDATVDAAAAGPDRERFDMPEGRDGASRMLETYAVRAAGRAVRDSDPRLLRRAAVALVLSAPVADWRDHLRCIAVVSDAASRIDDSLRSINHWLAERWPAARIEPLLDFDRRYRGRDRSIATMDFAAEGAGESFQYVDRTPVGASTGELADLLEAAGEPAELVAEMRADADADAEGSD